MVSASPREYFSLSSASMTTCDGRTHNVRVGDMVQLLDESQYPIIKITPPRGPVILKRTNHSTYRSFLWAPSQLFISAPHMVNQSIFLNPSTMSQFSLWDTNFEKESIMTTRNCQKKIIRTFLNTNNLELLFVF